MSNLDIFVFSHNFAIRQIRGCWFQIWHYCFQFPGKIYPNQAFLVPNLGIFIFSSNFSNTQIWGGWFQIWRLLFKKMHPRKYPNKEFLVKNTEIGLCGPKSSHICFFRKFWSQTILNVLIWNMTIVFQSSSLRIPS